MGFLIVLVWWLWLEVMGLAALPLAYRFFRRLPDRGYAFARPLGLLLVSYTLWLGGSLGLLRNSVGGALFSLIAVAVVSLAVYRRGQREGEPGLWVWLRANGRPVLAVELLFAGALGLWALLRAYSPEITTAGGEKFMEIMYLNSIARSEYFPPHDAWLSGYAVSYYYFGYVMIATLTRLSGLPPHLTFNVGLAGLFALTCTGAFGLIYNLVRGSSKQPEKVLSPPPPEPLPAIRFGFLGAVLVAVLGNLEGFLELLYSARLLPAGFWRWLDILEINEPFTTVEASLMPTRSGWWWWRASRVINDLDPLGQSMGIQPIDEFPGFSFLLGDMHPHVLALPFVLLALAIALNGLRAGGTEGVEPWWGPLKRLSPLVPLCLGALGFLNTWDFPIYLLVFGAAYALGRWRHHGRLDWPLVRNVGLTGVATGILGVLLYLPFYIGFQSQAGGLLPTLYVGTRFRHYFVMFGPFLVAIAGLLTLLAVQLKGEETGRRLPGSWAGWTAAFLGLPLGLMLLIVLAMVVTPQGRELLENVRRVPAVYEIVGDEPWLSLLGRLLLVKLRYWVMPLVVAGMAALGWVLLQRLSRPHHHPPRGRPSPQEGDQDEERTSIQFALLCAVVGLLLTLSVEFFYLVDNFRVRMNTIFKFYFQGWVLMAVASAFAVYRLSRVARSGGEGQHRRWSWLRPSFLAGFWLLFAAGMIYPLLGNISRANSFDRTPTLDGIAYLAQSQPDDYAAINWLNEQVDGAPVILEAPGTGGSSYVYEGRVSALTGLPTLLGWAGHEGQWRGSYEIQSRREPDIQTIYNTLDPQVARSLLEQYGVSYVYIGPLERSEYDRRGLDKFAYFMDVVYENEGVRIYGNGGKWGNGQMGK